ncbi:type VII secretion protein EccE [Micromonospora polyrhachis]|uniref:Type VII secretion protein EccE n=1 Tax=Micromonospora polyrhachis TaxID=1282883 RepID=A0A7W7WNU5_9ACTN|nr:type VII secretion protein EccE [Micromonospora polyrhachis]MBB4958531.1 type VII secretion protein EccE [Micromonospora polyrhachis]
MAVSTTEQPVQDSVRPARIAPAPLGSLPARRAPLGVRAGQIVAAQLSVALLLLAGGRGPLILLAAGLVAVVLVCVAWIRIRGRWLFEWSGTGLRFLTGRHSLAPAADPDALLDLIAPGTTMAAAELAGDSAAVLSDGYGLTAVLELGDAAELLADDPQVLPTPATLLPAPSGEAPPMRIQLLLAGAPAPVPGTGGGIPATSYRQLTDGRLLRHERALLAVRVLRVANWTDEELHRALSSAVRKVRRRLGPVQTRLLGESAALRVIAELAHHDAATPVQESWQSIQLGGLWQTTYRLHRWTDPQLESARRLVPRMLALPTMSTTVSLTAGPWPIGGTDVVPVDLTVRLAAASAADLTTTVQALRRLLTGERFGGQRLDGEHLAGFAATLPLGTAGLRPGVPTKALTLPPAALDSLELPYGMAGLMLGASRRGGAVIAQLFRAKTTDVVLVGGIRAAQLVVLRAMALGARIVVQTARPRSWEPFVRGSSASGEIAVIPPGRPVDGPPGTPLRPLLLVVDTGPVASGPQPGPGWQANLVVRDELTASDVDLVSRADLAILQPLRPAEAALAGPALGLGESSEWLTRIRADMVGVVNRRSLRWALLSVTPIESQLVGPPARD